MGSLWPTGLADAIVCALMLTSHCEEILHVSSCNKTLHFGDVDESLTSRSRLRSRTATALDPSLGEQRASTPVPGPAPHDVPMPSVEDQHASAGANQFGFLAPPGPSFAFTPGDRPAPPDVPGSSFAERHALTPFHGPMLHDATGSPFQEQHAPPNTGHRGAPEAFSREQRRFAAIYGAGFFHFPEHPSGEQNASAQGGSPGHPSGGQDPTAQNESPEQPPGEQMQKDSPDQEEIT